jgi:hypothetical protein
MNKGFIPVKRSLFNHFLFKEHRVFSRFEAWLDLIQMASFTDENKEIIGGKLIERNRGEVIASLRFLMTRWGWSTNKVYDYLELLRSQDMAVATKENGVTKIRLLNFEKHNSLPETDERNGKRNTKSRNSIGFDQKEETEKRTQNETPREHRGNTEGTNIIKDNKDNKGKDSAPAPARVYGEEEKEMFKAFVDWVTKFAPRVNQMKQPITIDEYFKLKQKVSREVITKVLTAMQNRGDLLKKYVSAYLTILNWASRETESLKPESNGTASSVNEKLKAASAGKRSDG